MSLCSADEPSDRTGKTNLRPVLELAWSRSCTVFVVFAAFQGVLSVYASLCYAFAIVMVMGVEARRRSTGHNSAAVQGVSGVQGSL